MCIRDRRIKRFGADIAAKPFGQADTPENQHDSQADDKRNVGKPVDTFFFSAIKIFNGKHSESASSLENPNAVIHLTRKQWYVASTIILAVFPWNDGCRE